MLFAQVDDRRDRGHRVHGEGRRVGHVRIVNPNSELVTTTWDSAQTRSDFLGDSVTRGGLRLRSCALVVSTVDESQRPERAVLPALWSPLSGVHC